MHLSISNKLHGIFYYVLMGLFSINAFAEQPNAKQVLISAGTYQIGCSENDELCDADEGEPGGITVTVPEFYIDTQETSVEEYKKCVNAGSCKKPFDYLRTHYCNYNAPGRENYPINCVNWNNANNYCRWRSARLAYEVEWEKAARAGTDTPYYWGHKPADCSKAVMDEGKRTDSNFETDGCWRDLSWPRNSFKANPFGIYDMIGGTSEWVLDWYQADSHLTHFKQGKLTGPASGIKKMIKGGSWDEKHFSQRVSNRFFKPTIGNPDLYGSNGIRCVTPTSSSLK